MILSDSILTQIKEQFISPLIEVGEFLLKRALKAVFKTAVGAESGNRTHTNLSGSLDFESSASASSAISAYFFILSQHPKYFNHPNLLDGLLKRIPGQCCTLDAHWIFVNTAENFCIFQIIRRYFPRFNHFKKFIGKASCLFNA